MNIPVIKIGSDCAWIINCNHSEVDVEDVSSGWFNGEDYHEYTDKHLVCQKCNEVLESLNELRSNSYDYDDIGD